MVNMTLPDLLLLALGVLLVVAAVIDLKHRIIPDWLNIAVAIGAPLFWWASGIELYPEALLRLGIGIAVFILFAGLFWLGAMGGGDVKLAGAFALWFHWDVTLKFLVLTSLAGGVVSIATLVWHRRTGRDGQAEVHYGVAIAFAGLWLLGQRFLNHFAG